MQSSKNTFVSGRGAFRASSVHTFAKRQSRRDNAMPIDLFASKEKEFIRGGFSIGDTVLVFSKYSPETPLLEMNVWSFDSGKRATLIDKQGFLHLAEQTSVFSSESPACFHLFLPVGNKSAQGFRFAASSATTKAFAPVKAA